MKKKFAIPLALSATVLLFPVLPRTARGQSFWIELNDLFSETYTEAQSYLDSLIAETFGEDAPFVQAAVYEALGALGLSDPQILEESIREGVIEADDMFDLSQPPALVKASAWGREADRQRLRSHVASVIGQEGQEAIQMKLDQISFTLEETYELGFQALDALSTQEAIKAMALQNVRNTELVGALQTEVINSRIDAQFSDEVLGNISQTLDEERTIRQNRDLAGVATSLSLASQAALF